MFRLLEKPIISHVLDKILFGESLLNIEEFSILEGSYLDGKYLKDFDFSKEFNIIVIGLTDKELSDDFILNLYFENHKIDVGDTLVAIGYRENLDKFNKYIRNGH